MAKVARKKFQEALRALKQACKNDRLSFALRIRAAELICAIYGVPLPESNARTRRTVRELLAENAFDRSIRNQVQEKVKHTQQPEKAGVEVKWEYDDILREFREEMAAKSSQNAIAASTS